MVSVASVLAVMEFSNVLAVSNLVFMSPVLFSISITLGDITFKIFSTSAKFTLRFSAERDIFMSSGLVKYDKIAVFGKIELNEYVVPLSRVVVLTEVMAGYSVPPNVTNF